MAALSERAAITFALTFLVCVISVRKITYMQSIFTEFSIEDNITRSNRQHQNNDKYIPLINEFNLSTTRYKRTSSKGYQPYWKKRKKQKFIDTAGLDYHDYGIFIIMYHKTGYVLTRQLKNAVTMLEIEALRPEEKDTRKNNGLGKYLFHGVDETGERFAFDTVGGWVRSAWAPRRHSSDTHCPRGYRHEPFQIKMGQLYLQESPDMFCDVKELERSILAPKAKIIHFVRNPFDMVLSNYFYHAQKPTPEKWVHEDDPCHVKYSKYNREETLASNVLPSIGTVDDVNGEYFDNIEKMCRSLFQTNSSMQNSTFYEHLLELNSWDGLRLATAQMVAASGDANKHLAGGDVARMANNIVKLKELQDYKPLEVEVLTLSTDDFIKNAKRSTMKFLDFVFGANNTIISKEKRAKAAQSQEETYSKMKSKASEKSSSHVTQSTTKEEKKKKERLKKLLHEDEDLAPILKLTENLVDEALSASA